MLLSFRKKFVEYTFKNAVDEKVQTIILDQYSLKIQSTGKEYVIPYAGINSVRLYKKHENRFCIKLASHGHKPIFISNKYYLPGGNWEDRSKQYSAFVRLLHHHLKDKSTSMYSSGFSLHLIILWLLGAAFVSFIISFISEYLNASVVNPFLQALILTFVIFVIIIIWNRGRLPKSYRPEEIPFQYLP